MTLGRKLLNNTELNGGANKQKKGSKQKGSKLKGSKQKGSRLKKSSKQKGSKQKGSKLKKGSKLSSKRLGVAERIVEVSCPLHNYCKCKGKACLCGARQKKTSKKNVVSNFKVSTNY